MIKPELHKCGLPDCREMIPKNQHFCKEHAKLMSEETKQEIWATWKTFRESKFPETRIEALRLYRHACDRAIHQVKDTLKRNKKL